MNELNTLFVEKYRPQTLSDMVVDDDTRLFFQSLGNKKDIPNLLFSGSPGVGKSTLGKIIIKDILDCQYLYINASDENGIDTIRQKIIGFAQTKSLDGKMKVVMADEFDNTTGDAQKALRGVIEEYSHNTRFIFTCNYLFKIIPALQSRCQIINLAPDIKGIVTRLLYILKSEGVEVPDSELPKLVELAKNSYPDLRRAINDIQKYSHSGVLNIKYTQARGIAKNIIQKLINKEPVTSIRRYTIESEVDFAGDYTHLLKEMFETLFDSDDISESLKSPLLLALTESIYRDNIVIDKEINMFSCCIKLAEGLA